ncbi:hypothetical protein F9288_12450 [Sphingomonas sp. CL5.1]|uniref:hypothetical protein n=1 Tax=Sphingomonas sp. CL5.1 TaxID=2653203 RepID=UPI00158272FD|nr:hypothetical protein [Sphingomonas sp. CL5.1]QKS00347.1 hypothetical protein F9288_12450 [Sphingomonas sp. CL5.1]
MDKLIKTSRVVATELRRAERSINLAQRDVAQFLLTTLDATEAHGLSPAMSQRTVRATVGALAALAEGQGQMAIRAHLSAERAGRDLGLDVTAWGAGAPKPSFATIEEAEVA